MPRSTTKRPTHIRCAVCNTRRSVAPVGRIPDFCDNNDACKQAENFLSSAENAIERWLTSIEDRATTEGRELTEGERTAATSMRSRLMSAANKANRLGSPKRIRTDRQRASWWNSREGKAARDRLAAK